MPTTAPYARVKAYLKEGLAKGRWAPGVLMPSESALVARFGVSRMTVNRAFRELQLEGLVDRIKGLGSFAAHLNRVSSNLTIRDLHEEIVQRGHEHRTVVHLSAQETVGPELSAVFGLRAGTPVFHTQLVHFENGIALQYEDRYVNPACAPHYLGEDFTRITPTQYLLRVAPMWEARYSLAAHSASAEEARRLNIRKSDACLVVTRATMNKAVPITLARLVHPGVRYQIDGSFRP